MTATRAPRGQPHAAGGSGNQRLGTLMSAGSKEKGCSREEGLGRGRCKGHPLPVPARTWVTLKQLCPLQHSAPSASSASLRGGRTAAPRGCGGPTASSCRAGHAWDGAGIPAELGCLRTEQAALVRAAVTPRGERGTRAAVCAHGTAWPSALTRIPDTGSAFRAAGAGMRREGCCLL